MERLHMAPGEAALDRLRQREPFATILAYDATVRSNTLEGVLQTLEDSAVHVIRLANPLRAPMTMERILIQLAGFQGELSEGEDTDAVLRAVLSQMHSGRDRLVISVEQAETLHPMALLLLDQIARPVEPGGPSPQVLFTGTPALARALGHPLLGRMRSVLGIGTPDPVTADVTPEAGLPQAIPNPDQPRPVTGNAPEPEQKLDVSHPEAALPDHFRALTAQTQPHDAAQPATSRVLTAIDTRPPASRLLTAGEARALRPRSRRLQWVLLFVLLMFVVTGGLYNAVIGHWLPPTMEAPLAQAFEQAQTWVASVIAAFRGRLLSSAALLY